MISFEEEEVVPDVCGGYVNVLHKKNYETYLG